MTLIVFSCPPFTTHTPLSFIQIIHTLLPIIPGHILVSIQVHFPAPKFLRTLFLWQVYLSFIKQAYSHPSETSVASPNPSLAFFTKTHHKVGGGGRKREAKPKWELPIVHLLALQRPQKPKSDRPFKRPLCWCLMGGRRGGCFFFPSALGTPRFPHPTCPTGFRPFCQELPSLFFLFPKSLAEHILNSSETPLASLSLGRLVGSRPISVRDSDTLGMDSGTGLTADWQCFHVLSHPIQRSRPGIGPPGDSPVLGVAAAGRSTCPGFQHRQLGTCCISSYTCQLERQLKEVGAGTQAQIAPSTSDEGELENLETV